MKQVLAILGIILLVVVICLAMGFPTMWLVNYLFASDFITFLFGMPALGFWKAFWLNVLAGILIKGGGSSSSS